MKSCLARKNEQISPCRILIRSRNRGVSIVKVRVSQSDTSGLGPGGRDRSFATSRLIALGMGAYSTGRGISKVLAKDGNIEDTAQGQIEMAIVASS